VRTRCCTSPATTTSPAGEAPYAASMSTGRATYSREAARGDPGASSSRVGRRLQFPRPQRAHRSLGAPTRHPLRGQQARGGAAGRGPGLGLPTGVVRLAAVFSDWCEYEPAVPLPRDLALPVGDGTRCLAGCGLSAVPYRPPARHVEFFRRLVLRWYHLQPDTCSPARSTNGATTPPDRYDAATAAHYGRPPAGDLACRSRSAAPALPSAGRRPGAGVPPFERPWMGRMIGQQLSRSTRRDAGWAGLGPRTRLAVTRRMPFPGAERKSHHEHEWHRGTTPRCVGRGCPRNLQIPRILEEREAEAGRRASAAT